MAWLTSAISVGTAVGSAAAGQIIDTDGARWGYAFAATFAAAAMLTSLLGLTKPTVPSPAPTPTAHADTKRSLLVSTPENAVSPAQPLSPECPSVVVGLVCGE